MSKTSSKVRPINMEIENMHIGDLYRNTKGDPYLQRLADGTYKVLSKRPKRTYTLKTIRTSSEEARFQKRKSASQLANMSARRGGGRRRRRSRKTVRRSRSKR